jgi:flavin-dependent dehydrogenase
VSATADARYDAVVAGAGPAGAVAAHVLARVGKRVLLADAPSDGAFKIGEALPGAALRLLRDLGLPVPAIGGPHTPIGGNLFSWGSDHLEATDFLNDLDGQGWRLDRPRFDADLRASAVESGAHFKAAIVTDAKRNAAAWQIAFADGTRVEARWIIDATGRRAAIARKQGAKRSRDARFVAVYANGEVSHDFQLDRTLIEAVPNGWWYAARLPNGAPIAALHLHPRDTVALLAEPERWHDALAATRHLAPRLAGLTFPKNPRAVEACGARLDRFFGDGWIACGDAALSFDPISSQGIFSALHGGMSAARAVIRALDGDAGGLQTYADRLEDIRRIYRTRWQALCRSERRWPDAPFWTGYGAGG